MRKVILFIASSLDGYIARENGDIDWLPENTSSGYDEFIKSVDTVIMGRKTYDQILTFGNYPYKEKKSLVFTRKKDCSDENVEFVNDIEKIKNLFSDSGKDIWLIGGAKIISAFVNLGIVDEIILSVIPVVLGKGIPLFSDMQKELELELLKTTNYEKLVELHYKILNKD
jgi:dihydrofolate reductase